MPCPECRPGGGGDFKRHRRDKFDEFGFDAKAAIIAPSGILRAEISRQAFFAP